jgi:hypothetical protein
MHGKGTFYDPRLNDAARFPIAAREGFANVRNTPDLTTSKLAALHFYQLSIPAPAPPPGTVDAAAVERGRELFNGRAQCATCHVPPLFTEPGWNMHTPDEIGVDDFQAQRSPDGRYRTTPLKGLWTHSTGGFYHDGRFAALGDVVSHYDDHFGLGLDIGARSDLVQYLLSLGDAPVEPTRGPGRPAATSEYAAPDAMARAEELESIAPNPSSGDMEIAFRLVHASPVDIRIYDVQGREVAVVTRGRVFEAGAHRIMWEANTDSRGTRSPGLYFVRLRVDAGEWTRAVVRMP